MMMVALGSLVENQLDTYDEASATLADTDIWVSATAAGETIPTDLAPPDEVGRQLAALPGVAGVIPGQAMWATVERDRVLVEGLDAASNAPLLRLARSQWRALRPGEAVVTRQFAGRFGLEAGDELVLPTPTGQRRVRLAATVDMFSGTPAGALVLRLEDLRQWFSRPGAGWYELDVAHDADAEAVRATVVRALADSPFPIADRRGEPPERRARPLNRPPASIRSPNG